MNEPTVYSYRYLSRFRWRTAGLLVQAALLAALCWSALPQAAVTPRDWIESLSILPAIPVLHLILFRFYAYCRSRPTATSADRLFSAWWGAGTPHPVPLPFFRGAECTVAIGSLLIALMLFAWLPASYGLTLFFGAVAAALPRLAAVALSLRQPPECRVRYEDHGVAFLLTDG